MRTSPVTAALLASLHLVASYGAVTTAGQEDRT
jgi:hypothetical protein